MNFKKLLSAFLMITLSFSNNSILAATPTDGKGDNRQQQVVADKTPKTKRHMNTVKKVVIPTGITLAALTGIRYLANSLIFMGSDSCGRDSWEGENFRSTYIEHGDLCGRTLEAVSPESHDLNGKCVLVFSPNAGCAAQMVANACYAGALVNGYYPLNKLLKRGAKLVGMDYRGYGNSEHISKLRISEGTVYADGEKMYDYVRNELHYAPRDIILYAHSLGGAVSSHVLAYASNKGENLCGIILASPINNLYSAASTFTCKLGGALARAVTMSSLNTEKNLRKVRNKNIPVFICSGDSQDFLSLEKTGLHEKIRSMGYTNVRFRIAPYCDHNNIPVMFDAPPHLAGFSMPREEAPAEPPVQTLYDTYISGLVQNGQ